MTVETIKAKTLKLISLLISNAVAVAIASVIDHALAFILICSLMIADVITGITKSIKAKRRIRSSIMFWGILHKIIMLTFCLFLSIIVKDIFGFDVVNYLLVIGAVIEMRSIDENMQEMTGFNFEQYFFNQIDKILKLKNKIEKLKQKSDESSNSDNSDNT